MRDITDEISKASVVPRQLWKIENMLKDGGGYKNKHKIEHRGKKYLKIKSEYRKKAKRYLIDLLDIYSRKELVEEDLEDIYDTLGGIDYSSDRVSSSNTGSSTESRVSNKEKKINELKKEIAKIDKKIDRFEKIKKNLTSIQIRVIEYKYLSERSTNNYNTWEGLEKESSYSSSRLKQIHKDALNIVAYALFGERAKEDKKY